MNQDFFDQNKLYLKSVQDYKTRTYKKPQNYNPDYEPIHKPNSTASKLPMLNNIKSGGSNNNNPPAAIRISMLQDENLLSDKGELSPNNNRVEVRSSQPHSDLEGQAGGGGGHG